MYRLLEHLTITCYVLLEGDCRPTAFTTGPFLSVAGCFVSIKQHNARFTCELRIRSAAPALTAPVLANDDQLATQLRLDRCLWVAWAAEQWALVNADRLSRASRRERQSGRVHYRTKLGEELQWEEEQPLCVITITAERKTTVPTRKWKCLLL